MKPELTLCGIPRLDPPDHASEAEHKAAASNPPTQYVAVNRVVMQGQVFVCRAPSHEKAKKLARLLNAFGPLAHALRQLVQWCDDSNLSGTKAGGVPPFEYESTEYSVITDAREAIEKAEAV